MLRRDWATIRNTCGDYVGINTHTDQPYRAFERPAPFPAISDYCENTSIVSQAHVDLFHDCQAFSITQCPCATPH